MDVRPFDPSRDSLEQLAQLNPFSETVRAGFLEALQRRTVAPGSVIVAVDGSTLVGAYFIHDSGLPFAYLDSMYILPQYRSVALGTALLRAAEQEVARRGAYAATYAVPQIAKVLVRYGWSLTNVPPSYLLLRRFDPPLGGG